MGETDNIIASTLANWEMWQKMKQVGFFSSDHVTLNQGQRHWKWHKMVEVNGVYKHDIYGQI